MSETGLKISGLHAGYARHAVLAGIDLHIPRGELVVLVGPNGCGKSTLLKTLARLHRPNRGQICIDGEDVWSLRPRAAARRIALLGQSPQAPEGITVAGLVRFGRHPHQGLFRQWSSADEAAVGEALAATGMTGLAERALDTLSGGQRQRAWLALTLAQQAPTLLLDEPTSMLDLGHQVEVLSLVRATARKQRTVIMVLHDLNLAARYADRLIALRHGHIVADGTPGAVVTPDLVHRLYDVEADVIEAPRDRAPLVVTIDHG